MHCSPSWNGWTDRYEATIPLWPTKFLTAIYVFEMILRTKTIRLHCNRLTARDRTAAYRLRHCESRCTPKIESAVVFTILALARVIVPDCYNIINDAEITICLYFQKRVDITYNCKILLILLSLLLLLLISSSSSSSFMILMAVSEENCVRRLWLEIWNGILRCLKMDIGENYHAIWLKYGIEDGLECVCVCVCV